MSEYFQILKILWNIFKKLLFTSEIVYSQHFCEFFSFKNEDNYQKYFFFQPQGRDVINSKCYANKKKKQDPRRLLSTSAPATVNNNLLGNFEESVLNGRLEPVSTVEGFTAEIGASGSFHPRHLTLPVTVFFYTLCENSNIASPYLVRFLIYGWT